MAGIPVPKARLLDVTYSQPDYKRGLIESIYDHVGSDHVDMVGLGWGVAAVHCVRAGAERVDAYEAAGEMVDGAQETFMACSHDDTDRIVTHHSVVGDSKDVYGQNIGTVVPPAGLSGDVLVLDCEGAELSIFDGLETWPEKVIVETHPGFDSPTGESMKRLQKHYQKVEKYEYEPDHQGNKRVLVGHHED
ncbi:hypothetical protein [Halolamina salifodinae]|uniref:hypothetical protein n=1 Tax=Halolamina salifodinae TaxID=1202767 RepID=UPI0036D426BC